MQKLCADFLVMGRGKVFCGSVAFVEVTLFPVDDKLALLLLVEQPVESHVCYAGVLLFHCSVDDSVACGVVGLNSCWGLTVAHFL